MAIGTGAGIWFQGTTDVVDDGATQVVTDGSFSADPTTWTNDDDSTHAAFVLKMQYPSGTIDQGGVHLYARLMNANGTVDEPVPSNNWPSHYLGTFQTGTGMSATTDYSLVIGPVRLPVMKASQEYEFYFKNDCNVSISAGWQLTVTAMSAGPHP